MDLQYILGPYACVMYIAAYMLKSERSMEELLKQVYKECGSHHLALGAKVMLIVSHW